MRIAILGAGVMGSALSIPLVENKNNVNLWGTEFDFKIIEKILETRVHSSLNVEIPKEVKVFRAEHLEEAINGSNIVVIAVAAPGVSKIAQRAAPFLQRNQIIMTVAKGLEERQGKILTMSEVIALSIRSRDKTPVVKIGGPSIAGELARKIPTSVVFASEKLKPAEICARAFATKYYKVILSDDIIGVEICATLKNIYAISVGMCDGIREYKGLRSMDNTKAAVFTQALREMEGIVSVMGGKRETVRDLAGVGDLEVTCRGGRNVMFGKLLGKRMGPSQVLEKMRKIGKGTVEGYVSLPTVYRLVKKLEGEEKLVIKNDTPLLEQVYLTLYENYPVEKAIERALAFPPDGGFICSK